MSKVESMNTFDKVYDLVALVPKGKVTTYGALAEYIGIDPRVVGFALHANNDPKNIPCHRVINSKGKISWGTEILKIAVEKMNTTPSVSYDNWKSAVYHTDQKPSGPKMKGRFIIRKSILPIESIYRTKLKKTLSEST